MSKLAQGCREYRSLPQISRRGALQAGLLGSFGLSLSGALRQEAQAANRQPAKAKSVILLWLQGGVSHHETFDPKPYAPADVRGEFGTISTNLPGVEIGELLPRMSTMMDKMAVVRSVTHREAAHQRGSIYMVEGRRPSPATGVNHSGNPELGSVIAHELGMRGGLPPFVSIPGNDFTSRFTGHGWLPATSACFRGYEAKTLTGSGEVALDRFSDRVGLRHALEGNSRTALAAAGAPGTWDAFSERAIDIITSGDGAAAFNIDEESDETKALYGLDKKSSDKGRLALTARRLVEAGVRYVTIGRHSWDHHSKIFPQLKSRLPSFDYAFTG